MKRGSYDAEASSARRPDPADSRPAPPNANVLQILIPTPPPQAIRMMNGFERPLSSNFTQRSMNHRTSLRCY